MRKILSLFSLVIILASCNNKSATNNTSNADAKFDVYKNQFVENLWKVYPGWASSQGYHKYDTALIVPNEAERTVV